MTLEQIVKEASQLPREQMAEVVDRLTLTLHSDVDPKVEMAWKQEIRRRLTDLESGKVQPVPAEDVRREIRKIIGR